MVVPGTWSEEKFQSMVSRNRSRHRSYCFTLNNHTFEEMSYMLDNISAKYWCFGFEVGEQGTPHMQGYIQFHNPKEFSVVKALIPRAHIEPARGTPASNIDYCSKDGEFYEFGDRPTEGGSPPKKTWEELQKVMLNPKDNITTYNHYRKVYDSIVQHDIQHRETETKFYVIRSEYDAITEVQEYFDDIPDLVVIEKLEDLADYPLDPKNILLLEDTCGSLSIRTINLFPRGKPITYRYGYEVRHVKPDRFIIESKNHRLFPLYKNIH